jgi:hypothetical protein
VVSDGKKRRVQVLVRTHGQDTLVASPVRAAIDAIRVGASIRANDGNRLWRLDRQDTVLVLQQHGSGTCDLPDQSCVASRYRSFLVDSRVALVLAQFVPCRKHASRRILMLQMGQYERRPELNTHVDPSDWNGPKADCDLKSEPKVPGARVRQCQKVHIHGAHGLRRPPG